MKSVFSKYGCPKCGKTTKIRWLPETYERWSISTPDELKDLHKNTGGRYSEIMRINESDKDMTRKRIIMTSTKGAKLKGFTENRHEIPLLPTIEQIEFPLKRISYSRYAENIRNACEKIGIKLTSHDFKHTFAYRCRIAGVDLQTFSGWLDHSHTKMSLLYSDHIDDEFFEKEAAKLRNSTPISTPIRTEISQNHV